MTILCLAAALTGCTGEQAVATRPSSAASPLRESRQMVLVVSDNWDADRAFLQCYSRDEADAAWQAVSGRVPVGIGRTGLAWGLGLHPQTAMSGPAKREGDGKAPAGAFALSSAFGYAPRHAAEAVRMPYIQLTPDVFGVDDVKSKHYNQIVRLDDPAEKDWDSAEVMRREDGLYEWGVVVDHNTPAIAGAGSCIFLHIWRGEGKPTAGCTAMSREEMMKLLAWLDPQARPVLVQLPQSAYDHLAATWGLPVR